MKMEKEDMTNGEDDYFSDEEAQKKMQKLETRGNCDGSNTTEWKVLTMEGALEPVKKAGKKKPSKVWNLFEKTNNGRAGKCNFCNRVLSINNGSISNLRRHIRSRHPDLAESCQLNDDSFNEINESVILKVESANNGNREHHNEVIVRTEPPTDGIFAQFIQSELNKFHSDYHKRRAKRAILQALILSQQEEDEMSQGRNVASEVSVISEIS